MGVAVHNPYDEAATAFMAIRGKNTLLNMRLEPKESVFLNTKVFLSGNDFLEFGGCEFTISVSENAL